MKVKFLNTTNVEASHLVHATGNDKFMPVFNHVAIDINNQKLIVTDAHILIEYPIKITESEKLTSNLIKIVPLRFFDRKRYMADVPVKNKRVIEPEFVLTDEYAEVYFCNELVFRCKYIEERPLDYKNIYPEEKTNFTEIAFNVALFEKVKKAIPKENALSHNLKFEFYKNNKGVLFIQNGEDCPGIKGIIMPTMLK